MCIRDRCCAAAPSPCGCLTRSDHISDPHVLQWPPLCQEDALAVGLELAVDDLRELPLQAAERLIWRLDLGDLAGMVSLRAFVVVELGTGGQMQGVVQGSVAAAVEAVTAHVAAGRLDGRGAGVAAVVVGGAEAADVAGVAAVS